MPIFYLPERVLARLLYGVDRNLLSVGVVCIKDLWGAAGLGDEDALGQIGGREHWGLEEMSIAFSEKTSTMT